MTDLVTDWLDELRTRLRGRAEEKERIVAELRSHIEDKVADLRRVTPERSRDEVAREVLAGVGSPEEIAVAYTPEAVEVRDRTGDVLLRVGRAVARGTGAFLKWTAVALAVLLVLGVGVGAWAYYEFKPIVERNVPVPVLETSLSCMERLCTSGPEVQAFYVHPDAREVRFSFDVWHEEGANGTVRLVVEDPVGGTRLVRDLDAARGGLREDTTWKPVAGDWKVTIEAVGFGGWLGVEAYVVGLPAGALEKAP